MKRVASNREYLPATPFSTESSMPRTAGVGSGKRRMIDEHSLRHYSRLLLWLLLWRGLRAGRVVCNLLRRVPKGIYRLLTRGEIRYVSAMASARQEAD